MFGRPRLSPVALVAAAAVAILPLAVGLGAASPAAAAAPASPGATSIGDSLFAGIGNGGYEVDHYGVELAYAGDGSIEATTTIQATAAQALSSFSFDFEGLDVASVTVDGQAAVFSRQSDPSRSEYKLLVTPAAPVSGSFTTVVAYSGTPTAHVDPDGSSEGWVATSDGATAVGQPVGTMTWLPSNNTPRDKATYDIALTVPTLISGRTAAGVSNGVLVSTTPHTDGTTTWVWKQTNPMATELALVSIGQYQEYRSTITLEGGRTIPEVSFVDPTTTAAAQEDIAALRAELPDVLAYLEKEYGPYPGSAAGVVVDNTDLGYALETQDRPFFERSIDEETLIHEFTHQWFGDAVSPADWNDIWLNEGPATYTPSLYTEDHSDDPDDSTEKAWYSTWRDTPASAAEWSTPPAAMTQPDQLFGWQVYNRGAMTLEALRLSVTTPVFEKIMREWFAERKGTSVRTADFIAVAEKVSGRDLSAFFKRWLFTGAKPAWPATWDLGLSTPSSQAAAVRAGSRLTYVITATSTGDVPLAGATVTADLGAISRAGTLDRASLPSGVTVRGTTLTWVVPATAVGSAASTSFAFTVGPVVASSTTATVTVRAETLGATCTGCGVAHRFVAAAATRPAPGGAGGSGAVDPAGSGDPTETLAATGSEPAAPLAAGAVLLAAGALLLAAGRRRRGARLG
ncbi:M1 family metallopeptidase [Frondihabitans peucedani]|uniref:Aminopeptidase N n=1 Tax=Frondihabitans peucedani TaxID=598626 RepID=A0ABP8E0N9_9MICO